MTVKKPKLLDPSEQFDRSVRRAKFGCCAFIFIPIGLMVFGMVLMSRESAEWDRLRPPKLTQEKWAALREQCETAELSPTECAKTPEREIDRLASKRRSEELAALCARDDRSDARREAENAVRASLKAPSSARFQSDPRIEHDGCHWTVAGEVDAENSFSAMMRSSYRAKLLRAGENIWIPMSVRVDE